MTLRNVTKKKENLSWRGKKSNTTIGITFSSRLREKGKHQSVGRSILGSVPFFFFMPHNTCDVLEPVSRFFSVHSLAPYVRRWDLVKSLQDGIWLLLLYWFLLVNVMGELLCWRQTPAYDELEHE